MQRRYRVEVRIYPIDEDDLGERSAIDMARPGSTALLGRDFTAKELIDAADHGCREALVVLERLASSR
ncbi:MAG: hypothetical protein R3C15_16775 [Thermoleophilia bacterium]